MIILISVLVGCSDNITAPAGECDSNMADIEQLYGEPIHIEYLPETYDVRGHRYVGDIVWFYEAGLTITFRERGDCEVIIYNRMEDE